ncbi:MAG TPA: TonB family protein [Candidatus Limnocylindrales bacterium]|nr:TonB family protein [Candidatus Limnocylindrales bacterium]
MDRLQKKCAIGSAGGHLLLGVVLFVGPAFLSSAPTKPDDSQILDIVPSILVDAAISGGGNPKGARPPAALPQPPTPPPEQPQPKPEPVKVQEPDPPKDKAKTNQPEPEPDSLELKDAKKKPSITLTPTIRKPNSSKTSKQNSASDSQEKQFAENRRKMADMIAKAAGSLKDDISSSTSIEPLGPGGGGPVYAGYDQFVRSVYYHAWVPPESTASDNAIVKVTVTIASDGNVTSSSIINASGDSAVDSSVRRTLDRVTFIAPFPEGAKDKQRVYTIKFDLKAKRLNG